MPPSAATGDPTHYDVLGVTPDATTAEIKRAFRLLMRTHHPDIAGPEGADLTAAITEAHTVLVDPDKRRRYDETLTNPYADAPSASEPYEDTWGQRDHWVTPSSGDTTHRSTERDPFAFPPEADEDLFADDVEVDLEVADEDSPRRFRDSGRGDPLIHPSTGSSGTKGTKPTPGQGSGSSPAEQQPVTYRHPSEHTPRTLAITAALTTAWALVFAVLVQDTDFKRGFYMLALSAVVGAAFGYTIAYSNEQKRPDGLGATPNEVSGWVAALLLPGLAAIWTPDDARHLIALAGVLAVHIVCWWVVSTRAYAQRTLDRIVGIKTLREHNVFGNLRGGVLTHEINALVCNEFADNPAARIVCCPTVDRPFSHAVVIGDQVALFAGVRGLNGDYWWSGPSLLCQTPDGVTHEIISGPYAEDLATFTRRLGSDTRVSSWLVIFTPTGGADIGARPAEGQITPRNPFKGATSTTMPSAMGPQTTTGQVRHFFQQAPHEVDQKTVISTVLALNGV